MTQDEYDRSIIKHTKNISDGHTLIQQQHIAAARIQAFTRMRQHSRRWVNITYPYLIRFRHVTTLVNDQIIDELLEDEIVPDVLIEIFSHAGDDEVCSSSIPCSFLLFTNRPTFLINITSNQRPTKIHTHTRTHTGK